MKARAGFTLLEVLLALAILGAGMMVLTSSVVQCLALARSAKEYETVRSLFSVLQLTEPLQMDEVEEGSDSGTFDGDFREYSWEREIVEVGEEEDEMFRIITTIRWGDRGSQGEEVLETYLHLPSAKKEGWISENASPPDL